MNCKEIVNEMKKITTGQDFAKIVKVLKKYFKTETP
jgi:hypothetical protein